jgi:hypothetical protein
MTGEDRRLRADVLLLEQDLWQLRAHYRMRQVTHAQQAVAWQQEVEALDEQLLALEELLRDVEGEEEFPIGRA